VDLLSKIRDVLRPKPLTAEQLEARTEAIVIQEQRLQDRASQKSPGAQVYRSGGPHVTSTS
jgi:hypothetical protein